MNNVRLDNNVRFEIMINEGTSKIGNVSIRLQCNNIKIRSEWDRECLNNVSGK